MMPSIRERDENGFTTDEDAIHMPTKEDFKRARVGEIYARYDHNMYRKYSTYGEFLEALQRPPLGTAEELFKPSSPVNPFFSFSVYHGTYFDINVINRIAFIDGRVFSHLLENPGGERRLYTRAIYKVIFDTKTQFHIRYKVNGFAFKTLRQLLGYFKSYIVANLPHDWPKNTFDETIYQHCFVRTPFSCLSQAVGEMEIHEIPDNYSHENSFVSNVGENWEMFDWCVGTETGLAPVDISDILKSALLEFFERELELDHDYFVKITKYEDNILYFNHNSEKCLITKKEHPQVNNSIRISPTTITYTCCYETCEGRLNPIRIYADNYPSVLKEYFNRASHELTELAGKLINMNSDAGVNNALFNYENSRFEALPSPSCKYSTNPPGEMLHFVDRDGLGIETTVGRIMLPVEVPQQLVRHLTLNVGTINNVFNIGTEETEMEISLPINIFDNTEEIELWNIGLKTTSPDDIACIFAYQELNVIWHERTEWWVCNNGLWIRDITQKRTKERITKKMKMLIAKIRAKLPPKTDKTKDIYNALSKIYQMITTPGNLNAILEQLSMRLLFPNLDEQMDTNLHLFPFTNGVYNLITRIFSEHDRNNFISITTGYKFNKDATPEEALAFISTIIQDSTVRRFLLNCVARALNGNISNLEMIILNGLTRNGKSDTVALIKRVFGNFARAVSGTLISREEASSEKANPALAKLENARIALIAEAEGDKKINSAILKKLTGSDEISTRKLYCEDRDFIVHCKFFMMCNTLPQLDVDDEAVWKRVKVIGFDTTFTENPVGPNQVKVDPEMNNRVRSSISLRDSFLALILRFVGSEYIIPDAVAYRTNQYRISNDPIVDFLSTNLVYSPGSILSCDEIIYHTKICEVSNTVQKKRLITKITAFIEEKLSDKYCPYGYHLFIKRSFGVKQVNKTGWKNVALSKNVNDIHEVEDNDENIEQSINI
jgi:P4 family phage/plasmid primase-like protien